MSFRSLADRHGFNPSTIYRKCLGELESLPHCADITRKYCNRFCGILLVDGKYVAVKGYERKIPVLYGIDYLTHDIPTYIFSVAENLQTCRTFFNSLRLLNYPLQAVVSDDNSNIFSACQSIYPRAISQICQNHYKQSLRLGLNVGTDSTYRPFMQEIEWLFDRKRGRDEFMRLAGKIYAKYGQDQICAAVMVEMQKRLPQLLGYPDLSGVPTTTNLIESFNSHLEGRLKTIKGFESFKHADTWLNGYFLRRRSKPFTDCEKKFRYLNGKTSLEQSLKQNCKLDTILKLIR